MSETEPQQALQGVESFQVPPSVDVVGLEVDRIDYKVINGYRTEVTPVTLTPQFEGDDLEGVLRFVADAVNKSGSPFQIDVIAEDDSDLDNNKFFLTRQASADGFVDYFAEALLPDSIVGFRLFSGILPSKDEALEAVGQEITRERILHEYKAFNSEERIRLHIQRMHARTQDLFDEDGNRIPDDFEAELTEARIEGFSDFLKGNS
jgi:hypothetical protein